MSATLTSGSLIIHPCPRADRLALPLALLLMAATSAGLWIGIGRVAQMVSAML